MLENKNIGYIALLAIAGVLIYYFFFKKEVKNEPVGVHGFKKKPIVNVIPGSENRSDNQDLLDKIKAEKTILKQNSNYVGPQDCAENCDIPYDRMVVFCNKNNEPNECLKKALEIKQKCLGKCDKSLPPHIDLTQEVATPLQENNYFSNLFRQGYV